MKRIYGNKRIEREFTKNDAPEGYKGSTVLYVVPSDVYFGESQEEADRKAEAEMSAKGQSYANEKGELIASIFWNKKVCGTFVKDDCESGMGSEEEVCVGPGRFVSYVSQEDADSKAESYLDEIGQGEANANGSCCQDFLSAPLRGEFFKNDCPAGTKQERPTVYELPAGAERSLISQLDADTKARERLRKEGQEKANAEGTCSTVYMNERVGDWFTKECPFGYRSEPMYYSIEPGRFESFVSVDAANDIARSVLLEEGEDYARMNGECVKYIENIDQEDNCFW